jgi:ankyrin repeat protein
MAKLLLDHGADPNAGVDSCEVALTMAGRHHGEQARPLQQLLIERGAFLPPYALNRAQLGRAIRERHPVMQDDEFVRNVLAQRDGRLLDLCLDADPTLLERMEYPQSSALLRRLLTRGLNPRQTDWQGRTFLHTAAENGDVAGAKLLLNAGADIHAREREFHGTPLAAAVRTYRADHAASAERGRTMMEFLLKHGARANLPDDGDWATPLAWATRLGHHELAALLTAHGAT